MFGSVLGITMIMIPKYSSTAPAPMMHVVEFGACETDKSMCGLNKRDTHSKKDINFLLPWQSHLMLVTMQRGGHSHLKETGHD